MLTYNLNERGKITAYEYLYQCIREDILSGEIRANEKLPSKRSLAQHLGVSVITVENAYEQLLMEGYVRSVPKVGFFVEELEEVRNVSGEIREIPEEAFEYSYFADLRSNRLRRLNFPFSTWSKLLRETLAIHNEELLKTIPYNGIYELRLAICNYLRENRGMDVHPQQVIVGAGTEYLYGRLLHLFEHTDVWAVENIGSRKIAGIYDMYRASWCPVDTDESGPVISSLKASKANVIHVSPANHFPFGKVMPIKRRQELLNWASGKPGRYILEDDYDSEFTSRGFASKPIYALDGQGRTIYMNTFSKTLIPSLRISYMILPDELMERFRNRLSFYSGTVPSMEQYTLARFISEGYYERHINHMKNYFRTIRKELLQAIRESRLQKISAITDPGTGTYFLLHLDTGLSDSEIIRRAAEKEIEVAALSEYLPEKSDDSHTLVINYCGIHRERISKTISLLEEIICD
jgi:GntR family transcriptional regulator/MocR family aminotransferase